MSDKPSHPLIIEITALLGGVARAALTLAASHRIKRHPDEMVEIRQQMSTLQAAIEKLKHDNQDASLNQQNASAPDPASDAVSAEVALVISASVTAYLGKKVRIRSAKALQTPYEIENPWAQHGRVSIHASHTLANRER